MNPAQYVVTQFGLGKPGNGLRETGRAIGRHHTSVARWLASKEDGGSGGLIPSDNHKKILDEARKRGLNITPDHLVYGDKIPVQSSKPSPRKKEK